MKVEFLDPAHEDLVEAIAHYSLQRAGLGLEFAAEVKRTIGRIVQFPEAWPLLSRRSRRCRTSRFPYGVIYQVRKDAIVVVAVMHLAQEPNSWKSRVRPNPA